MAKTKISEFDVDPANNTDINSINIAEGCAPSGINNAIRQLMSDLKEFQTGAGGDSLTAVGLYSDTVGEKTSGAGVTVDGVLLKDNAVTASGGFSGALNGAVGGTTPAAGAFTTLSASSTLTVTGAGSIQGLTVGRGAGAVASNTVVGSGSLSSNTTGNNNTVVGQNSLSTNSTGNQNTAVGQGVLYYNTGSYNTAVGGATLQNNSSGQYNTSIGHSALASNTTASYNTAVGYQAGYGNTTGTLTAFGALAGKNNTTGSDNASFGVNSLRDTTTGSSNSAFGHGALTFNSTGNYNTAIGYTALNQNTTASNNTAVGYQSGYSNTTGTANNYFGYVAGYTNTTSNQNNAFGSYSLYNSTGSSNSAFGHQTLRNTTTGSNNSSFGNNTLYANTTGSYNSAFGDSSLFSNTTASNNTAVGYQAGYSQTTSPNNTHLGYQAGYSNDAAGGGSTFLGMKAGKSSTGDHETFVGLSAGELSTGAYNTFIGCDSGGLMTSGAKNTILGRYNGNQGGLDIRTASNYIVLSDGDGNPRGVFNASGDFLVAGFDAIPADNNVAGISLSRTYPGLISCSRDGAEALTVNRKTNDGNLVVFRQDGTQEGSISVSGTTVSYNGGHLSRWSQWQNQSGQPEVYRGTVLESTNDMCDWGQPNEQATKTIVSTTVKSKAVAGVFDLYDTDDTSNPYDFYVAQSGDFVIRIAQGVVVENGDLLESAGDGTARPQADDICRSSTIAKVTSNYVSTTYADGSYCVPCILMIG